MPSIVVSRRADTELIYHPASFTYQPVDSGLWVVGNSTSTSLVFTSATTTSYFASSSSTATTPGWYIYQPEYIAPSPIDIRKRAFALRRKESLAKSSIKRALKLMSNFGMEEDARIFLSGSQVEVSHPDSLFKFVIQRSPHRRLIHNTHSPGNVIPYQLSLYTKSEVHVADLCVVMDQTPVFDQILALCMFVKTGNEEELLQAANYFNRLRDNNLKQFLCDQLPYLREKLH